LSLASCFSVESTEHDEDGKDGDSEHIAASACSAEVSGDIASDDDDSNDDDDEPAMPSVSDLRAKSCFDDADGDVGNFAGTGVASVGNLAAAIGCR